MVVISLIFVIALSIIGVFSFQVISENIKFNAQQNLLSIADLKVNEISNWRKEHLGDSIILFDNPSASSRFNRWLGGGSDIATLINSLIQYYDYKEVILLDAENNVRLSSDKNNVSIEPYEQDLINQVKISKKPIFSNFFKEHDSSKIYISVVMPIFKENYLDYSGAIILRIDPYQFIFPLVQTWPGKTKSAETLLVRKEGSNIIFLNELRHKSNTALILQFPLSQKSLPAAKAVSGYEGVFEGIDYRGIKVLAATRHIPDTDWFIVSKIDKSEVYFTLSIVKYISLTLTFLITLSFFIAFYVYELRGMLNRICDLEAFKDNMTGMIVHDLKNPLTVIMSTVDLFAGNLLQPINDIQRKYLENVMGASKKLNIMISNLLDIRKMESGKLELNKKPFKSDILEKSLTWFEAVAKNDGKHFILSVEKDLYICGDEYILSRVFENLIINALQHTKTGNSITINIKKDGENILCELIDDGEIIIKEYQDKIFDMYFTFSPSNQKNRTNIGLGLTFCKMAIEAHGSKIHVESPLNGSLSGVRMYFLLPNCPQKV